MSGIAERFMRGPAGELEVAIGAGSMADYRALARFHYRSGSPAVVRRVLVAEAAGERAGVLTVSMPTLEGRWREMAWPGRFRTGRKARDAAALNECVRAISRVIVEPRQRGQGIATALVRAYLREAETGCTEAVAAMGVCCPFFARAGMREWRLGPSARDARLLGVLRREGVEVWELVSGGAAISPDLERALRLWADGSRTTRGMKRVSIRELAALAAMAVGCRPVGYTWGVPRTRDGEEIVSEGT